MHQRRRRVALALRNRDGERADLHRRRKPVTFATPCNDSEAPGSLFAHVFVGFLDQTVDDRRCETGIEQGRQD